MNIDSSIVLSILNTVGMRLYRYLQIEKINVESLLLQKKY